MRALVAALLLGATAQAAGSAACPAGPAYAGVAQRTPASDLERFMMVSAYRLEPYDESYLDNVLSDLGRHHVDGVLYGTLGAINQDLARHGLPPDELAYNRAIYAKARRYGARLWLQLRVYDNRLSVDGAAPRNVEAREILAAPAARKAYEEGVRAAFAAYNESFAESCTVVMFEEAGIYHAPQGGGAFWSSEPDRAAGARPDEAHDRMFATRMRGLFGIASHVIKAANPRCRVGMHLGHSVFDNPPVLREAIAGLEQDGAKPDFIFYDFYLKAQKDYQAYADKLAQREKFIAGTLGLPALHLAQAHTMNNFQHGLGGTPSREELDRMMQLDRQLGFAGVGYYTKNATPTSVFDNQPLAPNSLGQATLYESAKDRWDYAMLKLIEAGGADFSRLFDLALQLDGPGDQALYARNQSSGQWDLLGVLTGTPHGRIPPRGFTVLRALDAGAYLRDGRALELRFSRGPGAATGVHAWLLPSQPAATYHTADALRELLAQPDAAGARGQGTLKFDAAADHELRLCLQ